MLVFKNQDDVRLQEAKGSIRSGMGRHLMKFFDDLQEELELISPNTYKVEDNGHAVILDKGDNVRDLSDIGLNRGDQGLLGCIPEWFETVTLDDIEYYRFLVLYNDSFGVIFYSAVGTFDIEVETWLQNKQKEYSAF